MIVSHTDIPPAAAVPVAIAPRFDAQPSAVSLHLTQAARFIEAVPHEQVSEIARQLHYARTDGRTVFIMGNGGSAATATHLANDLVASTAPGGQGGGLRALSLTDNASVLSALANDRGYDVVFSRQLETFLQPGDVVLGISASGNSPNCVNGLRTARAAGAVTMGLLGFDGGEMLNLCEHSIHVPSHDYFLVENVHSVIAHALTFCLRNAALCAEYDAERPVERRLRARQVGL